MAHRLFGVSLRSIFETYTQRDAALVIEAKEPLAYSTSTLRAPSRALIFTLYQFGYLESCKL